MPGVITPKILLSPVTSERAWVFGQKPRSLTTRQTRLARAGLTEGTRLSVRETVAVETLACLAIPRISTGTPHHSITRTSLSRFGLPFGKPLWSEGASLGIEPSWENLHDSGSPGNAVSADSIPIGTGSSTQPR